MPEESKWTPLHSTAMEGGVAAIESLIESGGRPECQSR